MATKHATVQENAEGLLFGDYAVLWGVVDAHRTVWTPETDFGPAKNQPVLYGHGGDPTTRAAVLGSVTERKPADLGLWVEAQLTKASEFFEAVKRLIDAGALGWSVGTVPGGYVEVDTDDPKVKRIATWLLSEMTLTPTPSQARLAQGMLHRSMVDFVDPAERIERSRRVSRVHERIAHMTLGGE